MMLIPSPSNFAGELGCTTRFINNTFTAEITETEANLEPILCFLWPGVLKKGKKNVIFPVLCMLYRVHFKRKKTKELED